MNIFDLAALSKKNKKLVVGLMSGTSLDGVDAVLLEIKGSGTNTKIKELKFITYPFPKGMKEVILRNAEHRGGNVTEICRLNFLIAQVYNNAVRALCKKAKLPMKSVDLIGSHGQTIHHLPDKEKIFGLSAASTLQIGDPGVLAKLTEVLTIGDFRVADVALGGQGAPLVPYFDYTMFSSKTKNRALLNVGGIANITLLKKNGRSEDVIAFDTGPGNMLIDSIARKFFNMNFDRNGKIAESGKVNDSLLKDLISKDNFIYLKPPKSTGREYYGKNFLRDTRKKFRKISKEDWITTVTEFTAYCVYHNYQKFLMKEAVIDELFVSGGGAKNKYLMSRLKKYFGEPVKVKDVKNLGVSADSKEAVCFAVLANETLSGNCANIPRVTGAKRPAILGKICLP